MNFPRPLLSFTLALAATLAACHRSEPVEASPATPRVEGSRVTFSADSAALASAPAQSVARSDAASTHLTGRLVWDEDATVRIYSPVAGRVRSVTANVGDRVGVDAPLAEIDSPDFGQAQADARKAEADLVLARRTLERTRELFAHGAAPQKDVEAAEDTVAGAEAEQQRTAARLALYGVKRADAVDQRYTLRTPLAGLIVERNLNAGQEVRPDLMLANAPQLLAPLFVVSDPRRLWVMLDVTEMDMALLKPGLKMRVTTRALPGRTFDGRLDSIGSSLDPTTRTVRARGSVDNSAALLKAEMYVDVELEVGATGAAAVEVDSPAVITRDEHNYVFVETAPRVYERREVQVGGESSGKVLLLGGVRPGEHVVVVGSLLVEQLVEAGGRS